MAALSAFAFDSRLSLSLVFKYHLAPTHYRRIKVALTSENDHLEVRARKSGVVGKKKATSRSYLVRVSVERRTRETNRKINFNNTFNTVGTLGSVYLQQLFEHVLVRRLERSRGEKAMRWPSTSLWRCNNNAPCYYRVSQVPASREGAIFANIIMHPLMKDDRFEKFIVPKN